MGAGQTNVFMKICWAVCNVYKYPLWASGSLWILGASFAGGFLSLPRVFFFGNK